MPPRKKDRSSDKSSGANAYELLLAAIQNGKLPPGSRLREIDLADQFGISRTPVREALKRLETQGLVSHERHHGAVVAQLDYSGIAELYFLREVLEGAAARLAATHATQTEIEVMKDMVAYDRGFLEQPTELAERNRLFHHQVHLSSRNRYLLSALENMRTSLVLLAGTTLAAATRGLHSVEEHEVMVDAIERHDPDAAEEAARKHIRNAFKVRIELRLQTPGT